MSFLERATTFLVDCVAPRLLFGDKTSYSRSRAALEQEAREELEARIRMGRPGPEEWERRPSPRPAPPRARPEPHPPTVVRRTLPVGLIAVTLDGLVPPGAPQPASPEVLTDRLA